MSKIKVIKTEEDHKEALATLKKLMAENPVSGSEKSTQLKLLAKTIGDYEKNNFPSSLPSPIEAIRFRMEQENLKPVDLVDFIGSRSKVSEVLSGKKPLTLPMIRALEKGLGIPAKVLIQDTREPAPKPNDTWNNSLRDEVVNRLAKLQKNVNLENLFTFKGQPVVLSGQLRQSNYRTAPLTDKNALEAWFGCVLKRAEQVDTKKVYKKGTVDLEFMREVARISTEGNAPVKVRDHLLNNGIILIIEPAFKKTRLDGAAIL